MSSKEKLTRIAIVNADRCKPKKCKQECKKSCPVVRMGTCFAIRTCTWCVCVTILYNTPGKLCIEVTPIDKIAHISETLCIGCGICTKVKSILLNHSYWYNWLCTEMPVWSNHHHQSSEQPWEGHYPSLQCQLIQASPSADTKTWSSTRACRY